MAIWVYGKKPETSQDVLIGPFDSKVRAMQAADKLDESQIFDLKTRNQADATRQVKAQLFEGESSPSMASKFITRFNHKGKDSVKEKVEEPEVESK